MPSKKYINRLLRHPDKAKCKECEYKMKKVQEADDYGSIIKYFKCENTKCGNTVDVSDYTLAPNGKYFRQKRDYWDRQDIEEDKKETIFIMTRFKLGDRLYDTGGGILYNPFARELYFLDTKIPELISNDARHCELIENIQAILNRIYEKNQTGTK